MSDFDTAIDDRRALLREAVAREREARSRSIALPLGHKPGELDLRFMGYCRTPEKDEGFKR